MENKVGQCRKIVVTGPVGVGKSTFLNNLASYLSEQGIEYKAVPEYIIGDPEGPTMLTKYFNEEITPYEFQAYIIDYYNKYLNRLNDELGSSNLPILLLERTVDDSVLCFGNLLYKKEQISLIGYYHLYVNSITTDLKFNIPSYFNRKDDDYSFMLLKTFKGIDYSKTIFDIIQSTEGDLVIGLYNDDDVCYNRVVERNREGEQAYSLQSVKEFNQRYNDIYNFILHRRDIPFTSIELAFT